MKKKKIGSLLALSVAAAIALSGCGAGKGKKADVYTIDWYLVTGSVPADTSEVEAKVNEYIGDKIGANLKMHYLDWGAYDQKLNVMIAGGDKFDICYTQGDVYRMHVAKGAYLQLDELMDTYAPKTKALLGDDFISGAKVNGKIYGIPANKDKGHHQGILYRTDIAEELGVSAQLDSANSMSDIYPVLDKVKEMRPDIIPMIETGVQTEASLIQQDLIMFPACFIYDDEGHVSDVVNYVETKEYEEACERMYQNTQQGYKEIGYDKATDEQHFIEFIQLKPGKDKEISASRTYEYTQVDLTKPVMTGADATGALMSISRTSQNPEKALQFLEMFNTDPYLNNLIVYGIEDKHYKKIGEDFISPIKDSGYGNMGMQWEFGNTFINYKTEGEDPEKVEKMEFYNENLIPLECLGFSFDSEPVKSEAGACANIKGEFESVLAKGTEPPQEILKQYRDKLKSAGADKIIAEAQRQYDEWKKTQKQ